VTRSEHIAWPGSGLLFRQLLIAVAVAVVWGVLLAGYTQRVGTQMPTPAAARQPAAKTPSATRTQPPTLAPTSVAAATAPVASATPAAAPTKAPAVANTLAPATNTPAPTLPAATPTGAPQPGASFSKDVLPIFQSVCVKCHGEERTDAGLALTLYADVMKGSENGPVVDPGKSGNSLLIELINNGKMPKRGPQLLPAQIRIITQWVAEGAKSN